jgi:tight adherence protein C
MLAGLPPRVLLFKVGAAVAVFAALLLLGYAAASAPTGHAKRLGLRGLKRKRALETVPLWAQTEPLVRWLGARFAGLSSDAWRARVDRQIAQGGDFMGLLAEETIGLSIVSGVGGLVAGMVFGWVSGMGNILTIGGLALGASMPFLRISSAGADRVRSVGKRLPYAIDLLALAMGAGMDFPGAVRQVVEKSSNAQDPVVEEFTLLLQALQLGRTRRQALEDLAARVPATSVIEFVGSVVQAELRGNPIVDTLKIQAEVSRRRRSVAAEEAASKAGVKMVVPLVLVFAAILILIVAPMAMQLKDSL